MSDHEAESVEAQLGLDRPATGEEIAAFLADQTRQRTAERSAQAQASANASGQGATTAHSCEVCGDIDEPCEHIQRAQAAASRFDQISPAEADRLERAAISGRPISLTDVTPRRPQMRRTLVAEDGGIVDLTELHGILTRVLGVDPTTPVVLFLDADPVPVIDDEHPAQETRSLDDDEPLRPLDERWQAAAIRQLVRRLGRFPQPQEVDDEVRALRAAWGLPEEIPTDEPLGEADDA